MTEDVDSPGSAPISVNMKPRPISRKYSVPVLPGPLGLPHRRQGRNNHRKQDQQAGESDDDQKRHRCQEIATNNALETGEGQLDGRGIKRI